MAIIQSLVRPIRGAESGLLRLTGDGLIYGSLRYVLAVVGSGLHEQTLDQLETSIIHGLERKIAGTGR